MIAEVPVSAATVPLSRSLRAAVLLLGDQPALGGPMLQGIGRHFASVFPQVLFHSVAVIDYDVLDTRLENYEIGREIGRLRAEAQTVLDALVRRSRGMGMAADRCVSVGTDPVAESAAFCAATAGSHPLAMFFLGKLVYPRDKWHHWLFRDRAAGAAGEAGDPRRGPARAGAGAVTGASRRPRARVARRAARRPESGYLGIQNHDDYSQGKANVFFKEVSVRPK